MGILCGVVLSLVIPAGARPPRSPLTQVIGETAPEATTVPLEELAAALTSHPKVRSVRIVWDFEEGSFSSSATVLYDRRKRTVRFYSHWGHNFGGNPNSHGHEHYLYTGVTDAILRQAAKDYQDAYRQSSDAFFDDLPDYGCVRHKLL